MILLLYAFLLFIFLFLYCRGPTVLYMYFCSMSVACWALCNLFLNKLNEINV